MVSRLFASKNGPASLEAADYDVILVPFDDGDLVDAEGPRGGGANPGSLFAHVLLVEFPGGVPIEEEFLGHLLERGFAAATADEEGEQLGVQHVVGKPVQPFALHAPAP